MSLDRGAAASSNQRREMNKSIQMTPSEKPKDGWIHVLEIVTIKRTFRIFTDRYDIKEQWFDALNQIVLHKEYIDQNQC